MCYWRRIGPMLSSITPVWPAIVHLAGADDLLIVRSATDWATLNDTAFALEHEDDRLIDSASHTFRAGDNTLTPCGLAELDEVVDLIRAHLADEGHCCVAKFGARSVEDAIAALVAMPL